MYNVTSVSHTIAYLPSIRGLLRYQLQACNENSRSARNSNSSTRLWWRASQRKVPLITIVIWPRTNQRGVPHDPTFDRTARATATYYCAILLSILALAWQNSVVATEGQRMKPFKAF
jgi:hypothetical protein